MNKLILMATMVFISNTMNYIINGNFDYPIIIPTNRQTVQCPANWTCNYTQLIGATWNTKILFGQFVDMEYYGVGNLSQRVVLPQSGFCNLYYYQSMFGNGNYDAKLQIWWNHVLIITKPKANKTLILQTIPLKGIKGNNTLWFRQVGKTDFAGTVFDNISLTCDFQESALPTAVANTFSMILSAPISSLPCGNYFYLFLNDLWLYSYDLRDYRGVMNDIFFTASSIDNVKLRFVSVWYNLTDFKRSFVFSNYTNFTQRTFIENQNCASTLIDTNFQFFIFTAPQTLLICLLLYGLFLLTKKYKLAKIIRPYYFIKIIVFQSLLEQNICYFIYICFSHLRISFTFHFVDKLSVLICVSFLFLIFMFTLTFYCFVGKYLRKNSQYFNRITNRNLAGYTLITYNSLFRSCLRGAIFYFLRFNYSLEMIMLSTVEFVGILLNLVVNQTWQVFKNKRQYCFQLIYYCLHFAFNIILCMQNWYQGILSQTQQKLLQLLLEIQLLLIKTMIASISISIILDILPLDQKQKNKKKQKEQQQIEMRKKEKEKEKKNQNEEIEKIKEHIQQYTDYFRAAMMSQKKKLNAKYY